MHADGRVHRWLNGPREGDALLEALRGATRPCLEAAEAERWLGASAGVTLCEDAGDAEASGPAAGDFSFRVLEGPGGWRKGKRLTAYKVSIESGPIDQVERVDYLMHEDDDASEARSAAAPEDGFEGVYRGFSCEREVRANIWLTGGRRLPTRALDPCALLKGE